jgi:membrane protein YdbS with pleckstrin-like domain
MRKLYSACLRVQYWIWVLYVVILAGGYFLGFFVNMLNLRWYLLPVTLVVFAVGAFLALVIVGIFVFENVRPEEADQTDRPGFLSALPSLMFLTAMSIIVWG